MIRQLFRVLDTPAARCCAACSSGLVAGAVLQGRAFALLVSLLRALLGPDPSGAWPWLGVMALMFAG